jgi:hypothetical protein
MVQPNPQGRRVPVAQSHTLLGSPITHPERVHTRTVGTVRHLLDGPKKHPSTPSTRSPLFFHLSFPRLSPGRLPLSYYPIPPSFSFLPPHLVPFECSCPQHCRGKKGKARLFTSCNASPNADRKHRREPEPHCAAIHYLDTTNPSATGRPPVCRRRKGTPKVPASHHAYSLAVIPARSPPARPLSSFKLPTHQRDHLQ